MSKSSQESSPITQWTETVREAVMRARHGDNYAEIMPADNPDDKADLAAKAITSATIELIENLLGPDDDHTYMERLDRATDPVRTRNNLRNQIRQSLKELSE